MSALKLMATVVFLVSSPAYAGSLSLVEKTPSSSVAENRERLSLHNRCVAAATYAMLDDSYPEKVSKAEYYRHRDAGEDIIRHVAPGKRMAFMANVPTIRAYQSVFQNLQWGRAMKALIKQEFEECKTI